MFGLMRRIQTLQFEVIKQFLVADSGQNACSSLTGQAWLKGPDSILMIASEVGCSQNEEQVSSLCFLSDICLTMRHW